MRFLKIAILAAAGVAALAGTSIVASAYPPPKDHTSIDCDPGHVSANNGSCDVVFVNVDSGGPSATSTSAAASAAAKDEDKDRQPDVGQKVCFTVTGPGTVTPACSVTNSKGKAFADYHAGHSVSCSGKDPDGSSAVIHGKTNDGSAQTRVRITCPNPDEDKDTNKHPDSASTHAIKHAKTTAARLTSLSGPSTSAGGLALGIGVLAFIVILSVAITGRLRLRGLRR